MIRWRIYNRKIVESGGSLKEIKHLKNFWTDTLYAKKWRAKQKRPMMKWETYLEEGLEKDA